MPWHSNMIGMGGSKPESAGLRCGCGAASLGAWNSSQIWRNWDTKAKAGLVWAI